MSLFSRQFALILLLTVLCSGVRPGVGFAQVMNFSSYTDKAMGSDETLYWTINWNDGSSGCTHTQYQTYGSLSGPGYSNSYTSPGMQTSFIVPNAADGHYGFGSDLTMNCSCFGPGLSAGARLHLSAVR